MRSKIYPQRSKKKTAQPKRTPVFLRAIRRTIAVLLSKKDKICKCKTRQAKPAMPQKPPHTPSAIFSK